jgi:NAD(P)H dehydrogenase (quinone)
MQSSSGSPILITGVPGHVGGVGSAIVGSLRRRALPVRALVHREDEHTYALRANGVDVVTGDLTRIRDVAHALSGCRRMYFGLSVSPVYLEATATVAAVARAYGGLEALVNISQMTVSQMSLTETTDSPQQRQHWLCEQVLNWSGLPIVHVRPTVFLQNPFFSEWAAESIAREQAITLPFGQGRTSPVDAWDVAEVIAAILADPGPHIGRTYELTGPRSQDMYGVAAEYAEALGRPVRYADVPFDRWADELRRRNLPDHLCQHLLTMAGLHADNRYDRLTHDVETITGRPATSVRDYVARNRGLFEKQIAAE